MVAEAAEVTNPVKDTTNDIPTVEPETLKDEFCSNESYEIVSDDQLVEEILVTTVVNEVHNVTDIGWGSFPPL